MSVCLFWRSKRVRLSASRFYEFDHSSFVELSSEAMAQNTRFDDMLMAMLQTHPSDVDFLNSIFNFLQRRTACFNGPKVRLGLVARNSTMHDAPNCSEGTFHTTGPKFVSNLSVHAPRNAFCFPPPHE